MKKTISLCLILAVVLIGVLADFSNVSAYTPALSIYSTGDGGSVQITVNGDSNSDVILYYQPNGYYNTQSQYLGATNYSGYFSTTISASSYNIISGSSVYVMVNNQQSSSVAWPYNNYNNNNNYNYNYNYNGNGGSISFSQSSVSVGIGQSATITISGGYAPYSMYPNSPNLYQSIIGGNSLTIIGQNTGSDSLRVCSSGSTTSCGTLYISINSNNNNSNYYNNYYNNQNNGQISLSQSSVSLMAGGSTTISIYGNGGYYISNNSNSNSNVATINISGSTLNIYGINSGSNNISICQNGGQCATLYISVGYNGYNNSNYGSNASAITFSPNNPSLSVGQSTSVYVYGGSGSNYNVAYNSNQNIAQANLSGSTLTINGLANGAAAIVICSAANNCGSLTVTVGSIGTGVVLGAQNNWTFCSNENDYCNFYGTQLVRYGANGYYYYKTVTGGTACTNAVFGDPIFGYAKQCSYGGSR